MRFEHIILLIIAFNVVSAVIQRRAKKRAEAEDAAGQGMDAGIPGADPAWREGDGGGRGRVPSRDRDGRERGRLPRGAAERQAPDPDSDEVERLPSFARDIFDQLARDLGLKVPRPQPRESVPPAPQAPRPVTRPAPTSGSPSSSSSPSSPSYPSYPSSHPSRPRPSPGGRDVAPPSSPASVREDLKRARGRDVPGATGRPAGRPVREAPPLPAAVSALSQGEPAQREGMRRPDLTNPQRLREAFILKEILDAPVARRPRR